jgi:hypothetical protein
MAERWKQFPLDGRPEGPVCYELELGSVVGPRVRPGSHRVRDFLRLPRIRLGLRLGLNDPLRCAACVLQRRVHYVLVSLDDEDLGRSLEHLQTEAHAERSLERAPPKCVGASHVAGERTTWSTGGWHRPQPPPWAVLWAVTSQVRDAQTAEPSVPASSNPCSKADLAASGCVPPPPATNVPLIGAPGFEPGTSPTRTVRATRLRHAPTRT